MRRAIVLSAALLLVVAAAGCGKKNSEKILGVWRTAEKQGDVHGFMELAEGKLILDDGDQTMDVSLEDKDEKVTIRQAGTDRVFAVVSVVDDNAIECDFVALGAKMRMVRSSKQEVAQLFHPPVENIVGFWKSEAAGPAANINSTLEISTDRIVIDGEERKVSFTTRKGVYMISDANGTVQGNATLLDDGSLRFRTFGAPERFIPSSAEEHRLMAKAREKLTARHLGLWQAAEPDHSGKRPYLEISEDSVDVDGEKSRSRLEWTGKGLGIVKEGDDSPFIIVSIAKKGYIQVSQSGLFGFGAGPEGLYRVSNRKELERYKNPKLEDYVGFWLPEDPETESFKAILIGSDFIVRDRRKEPLAVTHAENGALHLVRPLPVRMDMCVLSRVDDKRIVLIYGQNDKKEFAYRRVNKKKYNEAVAGIANPLAYVTGFWRSAEPVEDTMGESVVYATAALAMNVAGSGGKAVDWSSESFIQPNLRNRSLGSGEHVREGVFVFNRGVVTEPIELARIDGNDGSWLQVRVIDENTVEIATDYRDFVRCVRTTREEVLELRKRIQR